MTAPDPLLDEAMARSGLVWLTVPGRPPRAVWHLWHSGCAYVVSGGGEQEVPGLSAARSATVLVRSHERQGDRLASWTALVTVVAPGTPLWEEVAPLLAAGRLNSPDGAAAPGRWARESVLSQLAVVDQRPAPRR